jgi:hypothetical protein
VQTRHQRRDFLELVQPLRRLEISEMRRRRQLEEENRRLKAKVTDQTLDLRAPKDVLAKNGYGPR